MHEMTANEAKQKFGELILMCQRKPVRITKHGKPVAVMLASEDYVELEELRQELLKLKTACAQQEVAAGETVDGTKLVDELVGGGR